MRRFPAEWEPQSAVQLTFPHADSDWAPVLDQVIPCFVEIAREISRRQLLLVVCADCDEVRRLLADCHQPNLRLIALPSNDTWARDHGGIVVEEDGKPIVLDFIFNGWGLKFAADRDNLITGRLHAAGIFGTTPLQKVGLAIEGGSLESDGQGTLLTTAECLRSPNRNPHLSQADIEAEMLRLLGTDRVLWLHHGYLAGDDTDSHIDTLARFCDAETIAYVHCTDPADEHYEALRLMEAELQALRTRQGKPYRLVALPMADARYDADGQRLPATYANFLIINGAVLVPTYQSPAKDAEALHLLGSCFPDRDIIGIDCSPLILQHGSLHCVTMQYPAFLIA